jgi:hypothetical protein
VSTSDHTWSAIAVASKRISIDGNTYDNVAGKPIMYWGKLRTINTLDEARAKLGFETSGKASEIDSTEPATKPAN